MFSSRVGYYTQTESAPVNPLATPTPVFKFNTSFGDTGGNLRVAGTFAGINNSYLNTVTQPSKGFVYACCPKANTGSVILALASDGTMYGLGADSNIISGATTAFTQIGSDSDWAVVSAGGGHAAAIKTNGDLYTWGLNGNSQLGFGDTTTRTSPTKLGSAKWFNVSCGQYFTMGVQQDGSVWAWGINNFGQLGTGNTTQQNTPYNITTFGTNGYFVQAGAASAWVLSQDGKVRAAGDNGSGRLGIGNTTIGIYSYTELSTTNTPNNYSTLQAGANQINLRKSGSTKVWIAGLGSGYRLGTGALTNITVPTQLGTADWLWVSGGFQNGIGVQVGTNNYGDVYSWGSNTTFRTAQGTTSGTTNNPTKPASGSVTQVYYADAGNSMAVAIVK
jgi:alpha-tubulin suppressor-like RCC1 family protein